MALVALFPAVTLADQREFSLTIEEVKISVAPGLDYQVFAFNGQVPGPLIHVREGDDVTVHVTNNTSLGHSIHWHGIYQMNNWQNDGVHGVTQEKAIEPGETFTYHWKAEKTGSLWYHCHMNVHEHVGIRGMWGPLVVDPKNPTDLEKRVTKEAVMMMSAWDSNYADKLGFGGGPLDQVNYFSINAKSFPMNQPVRVKKGDVLRIRFWGAGSEIHSIHIHGHDFMVTHKDGLPLPSPYAADTLLIGPGERYDVIVEMNNPGRFMMHDHVDPHVTNNGKFPGGIATVIEYEEIPTDDWYAWKGVAYDPDFYYGESLKKGYGMFNHDPFKGTPLTKERRKRSTDHDM
jgi:FtsP/CotA-like multicopper oxidase with cupredoxin domain